MIEIKLNLGGNEEFDGGPGSFKLVGFTNIDSRSLSGIDIVTDIGNLSMFEPCVVDEIRASHVIEHIEPDRLLDILAEWKRVLKVGGILRIYTPDAVKISRDYLDGKIDCKEFSMLLFGKQDCLENLHRCSFDAVRLNELVMRSGFEILNNDSRPNSYEYDLGVKARKL